MEVAERFVSTEFDINSIFSSMIENTSKRGETFLHNGMRFRKSKTLDLIYKRGNVCSDCGAKGEVVVSHVHDPNNHNDVMGLLVITHHESGQKTFLTKDHIIPVCVGGANADANYQVLCSLCNNLKDNYYDYDDVIEFVNVTQLHPHIGNYLSKEMRIKYKRLHSLMMRKVHKKRDILFTSGGHMPPQVFAKYAAIVKKYIGIDCYKYIRKKGMVAVYSRKKYYEYLDNGK